MIYKDGDHPVISKLSNKSIPKSTYRLLMLAQEHMLDLRNNGLGHHSDLIEKLVEKIEKMDKALETIVNWNIKVKLDEIVSMDPEAIILQQIDKSKKIAKNARR